jgi:peptidoglycan hydrolase CwlO-like protein
LQKDRELDKLKEMIEKLQGKKEISDNKILEMKEEIKTLIGTIKEMEIALNSQSAEA